MVRPLSVNRPSTRFRVVMIGFLVLALAPVAAIAHAFDEVEVSQGPWPTEVLAVSGEDLIANGAGETKWSTDGGANWDPFAPEIDLDGDGETSPYQLTGRADHVADGTAVWRLGSGNTKAHILRVELASGDWSLVELGAKSTEVKGVDDTRAVVRYSSLQAWLVDLDDAGQQAAPKTGLRLSQAYERTAPKSTMSGGDSWLVDDLGLLRLMRWLPKSNSVRSSYLDVDPVDITGAAGPASFRITGWVPWIGLRQVEVKSVPTTQIEYIVHTGKSINYCTRTWNATKTSCKKLRSTVTSTTSAAVTATRQGEAVLFTDRGKAYLFEANKVSTVTSAKGTTTSIAGVGDPDRPLVRTTDGLAGNILRVQAKGAVQQGFTDFEGPMAPTSLDLSATELVGLDGRGRQQAWVRSVDDGSIAGTSAEETIPGATTAIKVSGSRRAVLSGSRLTLSDAGQTTRSVTGIKALHDLSGPYAWVTKGSSSTVLLPDGRYTGTRVAAIFGSTIVELDSSRTSGKVRDLATGVWGYLPTITSGMTYTSVHLWGASNDGAGFTGGEVALGQTRGDEAAYVEVFELSDLDPTRLTKSELESMVIPTAVGAVPVAIGDGVLILREDLGNGAFRAWKWGRAGGTDWLVNLLDDTALAEADTSVAPAIDGDSTLVFSTGTTLRSVDLTDYENGVPAAEADLVRDTGPLLLGVVAASSVEVTTRWSVAIDASMALPSGTLTISDQAGDTVFQEEVDAAGTGSVRLGWSPALSPGGVPANGTYTWSYHLDSDDPGEDIAAGSVKLTTAKVTKGKVTISGKAVVAKTLTAKGTWKPTTVVASYQWSVAGVEVAGADDPTYTVAAGDLGKKVSVKVTLAHPRTPWELQATTATVKAK